MVEFRTEDVSEHIKRIYGISTDLMYLIEGSEKSVLIDTGSGFGSLRTIVDYTAQTPVTVLLSHGHKDHAMGAFEFDEVYMNHADDDVYRHHSQKIFRLSAFDNYFTHKSKVEFNIDEDYFPAVDCAGFKNLSDGDSFDLGGVHVDVFGLPGHTPGSMTFLVREERLMILGDACNALTFLSGDAACSVQQYKENLEAFLDKTAGLYDVALSSHDTGELYPEVVQENIAICEKILNGVDDAEPFDSTGRKGLVAVKGRDPSRGHGNIVYNPDKIR